MQVLVFHPGTQHSWQTALALQKLDRLLAYETSIFYRPDDFPYRLLPLLPSPLRARAEAEFRRFSHPQLDPALVRTGGVAEWIERLAARGGWHRLSRYIDALGNRQFVNRIAALIRSPERFALWGYNGSSLSSFRLAKQHGRTCILDRTTGDFRIYNAMMAELAECYGEWFLPVERAVPAATIAADDEEYSLADVVLVGSPFAARTVAEAATDSTVREKIRVLNYCFDEAFFSGIGPPQPRSPNEPVRFLFMGLVIPRKGIHLLLEAISRTPRSAAELTIIGDLKIPHHTFARFADRVTYRPTVPRADVPSIMREHDVLVLPSYFEGAGIVLYEALAAGCAILQSDRCAIAATPETGLILPELSVEAVHAAISYIVENRELLSEWKANAILAAQNYTFSKYKAQVAQLLSEL